MACGVFMLNAGFAQLVTPAVIAAAGEVSKTPTMSLEWTLGEPAIETVSSKMLILTQGFHQPRLTAKRSAGLSSPEEKLEVLILPNPVEYLCRAIITRQTTTRLYVELADIHGRKLYTATSTAKVDIIDINFSTYTSGTYVLTVRDAKGSLFQTYKIVKAH